MSLTLILMRHAKSSWNDETLDDFDRPLNGRGRRSAVAIGEWLRAEEWLPEEVIVSSAARTVETWHRMAPDMPATTVMRSEPVLYHASAQTMLDVLRNAGRPMVMMIGHNPGLAEFANRLARTPFDHSRFADQPTAATSIYKFDVPKWKDAAWGSGDVLDFVIPRELI